MCTVMHEELFKSFRLNQSYDIANRTRLNSSSKWMLVKFVKDRSEIDRLCSLFSLGVRSCCIVVGLVMDFMSY